jgi:Skp family chaperone for outer membrane proteins
MSEHKPLIENSDRGLTVNKTLGWTMLVTIVGLIFYAGSTLASLQHSIGALSTAVLSQQSSNAALEIRVRALENQAGRFDEKLQNILTVLGRIDNKLEARD